MPEILLLQIPEILLFDFFCVILPYCLVISLGIIPCLANRKKGENQKTGDCPLLKIWTWLQLLGLIFLGDDSFYHKSMFSVILFHNSYPADYTPENILETVIPLIATYIFTFLVLLICALVLGAYHLILWRVKKKHLQWLSSPVLVPLAAIAVFSMFYGSQVVLAFIQAAFIIKH